MATRVLGPTGSRRRRRFLFAALLLVACTALFMVGSARAVHDTGLFQLDGDAFQATVPAGHLGGLDDWDSICNEHLGTPPSTPGPLCYKAPGAVLATTHHDDKSTFITDAFNAGSDNIFKGGTDDADISSWQWKQATPSPNKADLENAFAAQYTGTAAPYLNHKLLFFGGDRFSNNGDTNIGLWFFHNPVSTSGKNTAADGSCPVQSGCGFTGLHKAGNISLGGSTGAGCNPNPDPVHNVCSPGDIFILSSFTGGGAEPTIKVFEWVGPGKATKNYLGSNNCFTNACTLQPLPIPPTPGFTDNRCDGAPVSGDVACAIVNAQGPIPSPWLFQDQASGSPPNVIGTNEFYEGGLDLTGLGFGDACFSSVLLNTRSSQSGTSVLQDFALGGFGSCNTNLTTTPQDAATPPANLTDSNNNGVPDVSIGTGSVQVTDSANLQVNGIGSFTGTLAFHLCFIGTDLTSTATCSTGGTSIALNGTNPVTQNGTYHSVAATVTSVGRYCWRGDFTSGTTGVPNAHDSTTGECFEVLPVTPTLSTSATSAVEIGNAIDDKATLGGTANEPGTPVINPTTAGSKAGGTITFRLYGPSGTTADCSAPKLIGTSVVDIKNGGNGDYNASNGTVSGTLTPTAAGTYYWTAQYSGDSPNTNPKGPTTCGDTGESSRVVDAKISITPTKTNEVGVPHTFTVNIQATDASGTFQPVSGLNPAVTLTPSNGASVLGKTDNCAPLPAATDLSGNCTVVFHSDTGGQVTGHASITFSVAGVSLTRATGDSHTGDSSDAVKTYVDAKISIAPNKTNEVGQPHTFTVTLLKNAGDGNGFVAAAGEHVDFTLTNSNGANAVLDAANSTCDNAGPNTDAAGQCTIVFTSATAGQVTGHAFATLSVGGVSLTRATGDSHTGDSADAVKTFVDLEITIGPPVATNTVGDPHTFTVTVLQDDGLTAAQGGDGVTGFGPVPNGTGVTVTLVNSDGANFEIPIGGDTCVQPSGGGTVNGVCTVTFTSQTAGTVTGNASVSLSVGGVPLTRDTDPATTTIPCGGALVQGTTCGPAIKHFVAGSISWTKVDNANPARALAGATFALCRTKTYNFTTKGFDPIPSGPDCSFGPVVDNTGPPYTGADANPIGGQFQVIGLPLGEYTVQETVPPQGYVVDPNTRTVDLSPNDPGPPFVNHTDQTISIPFVDLRPIVKITGLSYTNAPDTSVDQPDGINVGNTTFTVNLHNYGGADAVLADSSFVVSNPASNAGLTCNNAAVPFTLPITGTITAGQDNSSPITLSCHYDHPNGKTITGTLVVKYFTNVVGDTLERTASGSPATISFTVNPN